jgi:hypothetical protein
MPIVGENQFVDDLEDTFGLERANEVKTLILKYARWR